MFCAFKYRLQIFVVYDCLDDMQLVIFYAVKCCTTNLGYAHDGDIINLTHEQVRTLIFIYRGGGLALLGRDENEKVLVPRRWLVSLRMSTGYLGTLKDE